MIQIGNGFAEYYYLMNDGNVYNNKTNNIIKPNKRHLFFLNNEQNKKKYVAQRTLYRIVLCQRYCIDEIQDLKDEQWKEITDTNGIYYVSSRGRIKSLQGYHAKILKPYTNQSDYERVEVVYSDKRRSVLVHRLVAQAFLPNPEDINMQLHHKDFDKHNNNAENLIWLSPTEHSLIHQRRSEQDLDEQSS